MPETLTTTGINTFFTFRLAIDQNIYARLILIFCGF